VVPSPVKVPLRVVNAPPSAATAMVIEVPVGAARSPPAHRSGSCGTPGSRSPSGPAPSSPDRWCRGWCPSAPPGPVVGVGHEDILAPGDRVVDGGGSGGVRLPLTDDAPERGCRPRCSRCRRRSDRRRSSRPGGSAWRRRWSDYAPARPPPAGRPAGSRCSVTFWSWADA